jgi:hypothetical protein
MKHTFIFLVLFISFLSKTFSQEVRILDGYIVNLKQDTIKGKVFFEDWEISPSKITFVDANNNQIYNPTQILGFGIYSNNEIYDSKEITINYVNKVPVTAGKSPFNSTDILQVFMQKILLGNKVSIYKYVDKERVERFFIEKDNDLLELINYSFTQNKNGTNYLVKDETYKSQLKNICNDAENFKASLPLYEETSLKNYFTKYNACFIGSSVDFSNKKEGSKISFGLTGGINNLTYVLQNDFSTNQMLGASVRLLLPRLFNNRFVKFYMLNTPKFTVLNTDINKVEKNPLSEFGVTFGRYIGKKKLQPLASFTMNYVQGYGEFNMGFNLGVSYDKKIELEINRVVTIFGPSYLQSPKVSLTYFINIR